MGWSLTLAWESETLGRTLPCPRLPVCRVVCASVSPSLAPDSLRKKKRGWRCGVGRQGATRLLRKCINCGLGGTVDQRRLMSRGQLLHGSAGRGPKVGLELLDLLIFQWKAGTGMFMLNLSVLKCWLLTLQTGAELCGGTSHHVHPVYWPAQLPVAAGP